MVIRPLDSAHHIASVHPTPSWLYTPAPPSGQTRKWLLWLKCLHSILFPCCDRLAVTSFIIWRSRPPGVRVEFDGEALIENIHILLIIDEVVKSGTSTTSAVAQSNWQALRGTNVLFLTATSKALWTTPVWCGDAKSLQENHWTHSCCLRSFGHWEVVALNPGLVPTKTAWH